MVIDCHAHLAHHTSADWEEADRKLIEAADKLGIDQLCCSTLTPKRPAEPAGFREANEFTYQAMERFPGRVLGYCYVNPGWRDAALDEVRRCVEERGFMGIKLYNEYQANEPVAYPVAELAVELRVPILYHAGHSHHHNAAQPRISDGGMIAELADRYPEARLICGHVAGGGDWEWTIKALRRAPSVYLDTSGSVVDDGMIELAAKVLGADRLLFGCDMSMTAGVGKLRSADLSAADKRKILATNMQKILARRGSSC
jgi:predicted TIM-barrel fold metal-dependent hydrolase